MMPYADPPLIRPCRPDDIAAVTAIYAHHVRHSRATFELDPPDTDEMRRRYENVVSAGFPYLVAERAGEILGYAYAAPYRPRPAYRYTAENSVYIRDGAARQGIGGELMRALIAACEAQGLRQLVAVIGDGANTASIALHRSLGFAMVGTLAAVGRKFDGWIDVVLMQRALGAGDRAPPP